MRCTSKTLVVRSPVGYAISLATASRGSADAVRAASRNSTGCADWLSAVTTMAGVPD